jgi:hypothetical protein
MRQIGQGTYAKQLENMFDVACRRAKFGDRPQLSTASFRRAREQLHLSFG